MIICRTPFRLSFFGGGTDYPVWYKEHGGAVLSTTIDKFCYVTLRTLPPFFDFKYRMRYYRQEECKKLDDIQHNSVRECLRFLNFEQGIEMIHCADIPAQSGIGSSSSFTVCMLHALYSLKNYMPTRRQLALNAIEVEQKRIKEAVGSQDQVAAAFGGFNRIDFGGAQEIQVTPMILSEDRLRSLQDHMLLFFTGLSRNAFEIATKQIASTKDKAAELAAMMELLEQAQATLSNHDAPIEDFGRLLHEQWMIKRGLTDVISNDSIDRIYQKGREAGAIGGKLCGAGSGGFMLLFARPEDHPAIRSALCGLLEVPFYFDNLGSQVIYHSKDFAYDIVRCSNEGIEG